MNTPTTAPTPVPSALPPVPIASATVVSFSCRDMLLQLPSASKLQTEIATRKKFDCIIAIPYAIHESLY